MKKTVKYGNLKKYFFAKASFNLDNYINIYLKG